MRIMKKKLEILSYLYQLRTLSYKEIYNFLFQRENLADSYCHRLIRELISDKLIEKLGYHKTDMYFFITNAGIKELKTNGIFIIGQSDLSTLPIYYTAKKLKIKDHNINHQLSLNHFVLTYGTHQTFDYFDEKYISLLFSGCRPDGIIKEPGRLLFLEMDMNTERKRALEEKWKHYRIFLDSEEYFNLNTPIKVLFILGGGIDYGSRRATLLRDQIYTFLFDQLSENFNMIIGTEDTIINGLRYDNRESIRISLAKQGYNIKKGRIKDDSLSGFNFDFYINKNTSEGTILFKGGFSEEFLIDDVTDCNMYSYSKLRSADSFISKFSHTYGRDIKYIAVMDSEETAFNIFREIEYPNLNIYFSTPKRIRHLPLHNAIFQMSRDGRIWHFSEDSLGIPIEEKRMNWF